MKNQLRLLLATLAVCVSGVPVTLAQPWISHYTDTNLDFCTRLSGEEYGAEFACPGYKGYPLWIAEGDLRFFVSYGINARNEKARLQTMPGFNTIGQKLEWLIGTDAQGNEAPVASILRYYISRSEAAKPDAQILVVTKISTGNTCHVAYVDALANVNANAMARKVAADMVPGWNCETMQARAVGQTSIHGL